MTEASPAVQAKGIAYLTSGAVKVLEHTASSATIEVSGSSKVPYTVRFSQGVWMCDCPGGKHGRECAHRFAAKLISPLRTEVGPLTGSTSQAEAHTDLAAAQEIADLLGPTTPKLPKPAQPEPDSLHDLIQFLDEVVDN